MGNAYSTLEIVQYTIPVLFCLCDLNEHLLKFKELDW